MFRNSVAPLRICESRSVSDPSWLAGKNRISSRPFGGLTDAAARLFETRIDRLRQGLPGRELVAELGSPGRADAHERRRQGGADNCAARDLSSGMGRFHSRFLL